MPTTSGTLAAGLLDALAKTGIEFAILHGEPEIARGEVSSDIDLAVGAGVFETMRALIQPADAAGLVPIVVWPYDLASASSFWATADARDGVHLDMTGDPRGVGRYGFRTSEILERSTPGVRWPVISGLDEMLYELRKQQLKRYVDRTRATRSDIEARFGMAAAESRIESLFAPAAASSVRDLLHRGAGPRSRGLGQHLVRSTRRVGWRVLHPVGFWAELEGSHGACGTAVADRFRRFLVGSASLARGRNDLRHRALVCSEFARRRWRPQLLVTTVASPPAARWPRPDLIVRADLQDLDSVCTTIVTTMRARTLSRIGAVEASPPGHRHRALPELPDGVRRARPRRGRRSL